jgi:hypothetical protein
MVITILEAQVQSEHVADLKAAFTKHTSVVPDSIVQSYLAQSRDDRAVWRTAEDLAAMRASGETPTGVVIFPGRRREAKLIGV